MCVSRAVCGPPSFYCFFPLCYLFVVYLRCFFPRSRWMCVVLFFLIQSMFACVFFGAQYSAQIRKLFASCNNFWKTIFIASFFLFCSLFLPFYFNHSYLDYCLVLFARAFYVNIVITNFFQQRELISAKQFSRAFFRCSLLRANNSSNIHKCVCIIHF